MGSLAGALPAAVSEDLRARIRNVHRVGLPGADGWSLGVDADDLGGLLRTWAEQADRHDVEARTRALPWVLTERQVVPIRAVHQRAAAPGASAFTMFPGDLVNAPREFAARFFDIHSCVDAAGGGHLDA